MGGGGEEEEIHGRDQTVPVFEVFHLWRDRWTGESSGKADM